MPTDKTYTFNLAEPKEDKPYCKEELLFQAGITEAVRRVLCKRDDYDLIKFIRVILDVEVEKDDE